MGVIIALGRQVKITAVVIKNRGNQAKQAALKVAVGKDKGQWRSDPEWRTKGRAWAWNDEAEFLNPRKGYMAKYAYEPKDKVVTVKGVGKKPSKVTILATGKPLDYRVDGKTLTFTIPADRTAALLDVIKVRW